MSNDLEEALWATEDAIRDIGGTVTIDQVNQWFRTNRKKGRGEMGSYFKEDEEGILVAGSGIYDMAVERIYRDGYIPKTKAQRLPAELTRYLGQLEGEALANACQMLLGLASSHLPRLLDDQAG